MICSLNHLRSYLSTYNDDRSFKYNYYKIINTDRKLYNVLIFILHSYCNDHKKEISDYAYFCNLQI